MTSWYVIHYEELDTTEVQFDRPDSVQFFLFSAHFIVGYHGFFPLEMESTFTATQSHIFLFFWPNSCFLLKHLTPADLMIGNHSRPFWSSMLLLYNPFQHPVCSVKPSYYLCIYISLPLYSSSALLQINFRCKPSFRESGSRNIREVSLGLFFVQILVLGGSEQCCCWSWFAFL